MAEKKDNEQGKAVKEDPTDESHVETNNIEDSPETQSRELSLEEKFSQLEKEHLYLRAEMEKIKRHNLKERSQLLKYGGERLARDLLDTLDVFNSALENEVTGENYDDFVQGIKMTSQSLKTALEKHGVVEVECLGQAFDPNTQEALSSEPSDEYPEGFVTQVFKPPYKYQDKLLRPGQVIVSRTKSEVP